MNLVGQGIRLHPGGGVHRITKQTISGHLHTHYSRHHRSAMDANAHAQFLAWSVADPEAAAGDDDVQRHVGDVARMLDAVAGGQARDAHVCVAYSLHLKIRE